MIRGNNPWNRIPQQVILYRDHLRRLRYGFPIIDPVTNQVIGYEDVTDDIPVVSSQGYGGK